MKSNFRGTLLAITVVTNRWLESLIFYQRGLGYKVVGEGTLTNTQKKCFGDQLSRYILLGHDRAGVVRLIETEDTRALPNRLGARPWDIGLCVVEAGALDVDAVYENLICSRIGVIAPPEVFSVQGPDPLGYVEMKALGLFGPNGEQFFITQITDRQGGTPLWEQRQDLKVFPPGNVVMSLKDRAAQGFYKNVFALEPTIDLPLSQRQAAKIMGGPPDMSFRMCLMGNGDYKSGMEQHVYGITHPEYDFKKYPCDFKKTGLASACWNGRDMEGLSNRIVEHGGAYTGDVLLPLRDNPCPSGVVYRGPAGEIIELAE